MDAHNSIKIMTKSNPEILNEIIRDYGLNAEKVAEMLSVSIHTVRSWTIHKDAPKHRNMPDRHIKLLKLLVRNRKKLSQKATE